MVDDNGQALALLAVTEAVIRPRASLHVVRLAVLTNTIAMTAARRMWITTVATKVKALVSVIIMEVAAILINASASGHNMNGIALLVAIN